MFRLAGRQAGGLLGSVVGRLGLALRVPDRTTLSRRAAMLQAPRPRQSDIGAGAEADSKPMHLLVDSTGSALGGAGEGLLEKHATKTRRSRRTLHLGVDADIGQIVASTLTSQDVDDGLSAGIPSAVPLEPSSAPPRPVLRSIRSRARMSASPDARQD